MEKEFIPYELAVKLKALGFDEPCLAWFNINSILLSDLTIGYEAMDSGYRQEDMDAQQCTAPTFSQAFRWFRKKYGFYVIVQPSMNNDFSCVIWSSKSQNHTGIFKTYEEAELACLDKLIGIVQKNITTKALN